MNSSEHPAEQRPEHRPEYRPEHPGHDHERTDVQAPVLGWLALALAIFLLAVMPLLIGVFKWLKWEDARDPTERSPLAKIEQPPPPVLQAVPSVDLGEYRRGQRKLLAEYQWIDKQQQIVRIPIDEATRLLAERGLPKVPPAAAPGAPAAAPAAPENPVGTGPVGTGPVGTGPGEAKAAAEASP